MDTASAVVRGRSSAPAPRTHTHTHTHIRCAHSSRRAGGKRRTRKSPRGRSGGKGQGVGTLIDARPADSTVPFFEIRPQVIVVDDHVNFCTGLRFAMEGRGFGLSSARSSAQALDMLRRSSFDVALIDWKLDGSRLDGLELLRRIRSTYHDLPTAFITGFDNEDVQRDSRRAGADAYLVKPGEREEICDVLVALAVTGRSRGAWQALSRLMDELGVSLADLDAPVRRALAKMCTSLGQGLRRADVAECVELSEDRFSRVFRRGLGVGWKQFLTELQVETAKELLNDPSLSVSAVATRVGFGCLKNMERAFDNLIGLAPTEFRKRLEDF